MGLEEIGAFSQLCPELSTGGAEPCLLLPLADPNDQALQSLPEIPAVKPEWAPGIILHVGEVGLSSPTGKPQAHRGPFCEAQHASGRAVRSDCSHLTFSDLEGCVISRPGSRIFTVVSSL